MAKNGYEKPALNAIAGPGRELSDNDLNDVSGGYSCTDGLYAYDNADDVCHGGFYARSCSEGLEITCVSGNDAAKCVLGNSISG